MKLLIFQSEFMQHSAQLQQITSNHQQVTVNQTDCVYCHIDNANAFSMLESQLNANRYAKGDGILLPKEAL